MLQGGAEALIVITVPSIVAIEWPDQNDTYQGYVGISMGIGLTLGPVISSGVVRILNYFWTLIFFAVFVFVLCGIAICFIPSRIDNAAKKQ